MNCAVGSRLFDESTFRRPEVLAQLKAELRQALQEVEEAERLHEESLKPRTLEEVDLLEEKLTAALQELQLRRAELTAREEQRSDQGDSSEESAPER